MSIDKYRDPEEEIVNLEDIQTKNISPGPIIPKQVTTLLITQTLLFTALITQII